MTAEEDSLAVLKLGRDGEQRNAGRQALVTVLVFAIELRAGV